MRRRIGQWPFFELPPWLRLLVAVVVAAYTAAIAAGLAVTPLRAGDAGKMAVLLAFGAATVELTRRTGEPGPWVRDVNAVWDLPAAILLPPLYVLVIPIPRMIHSQFRVRTSKVHRRAYTASAVGLAYAAASLVFHASWPAGRSAGTGLLALAWVGLAAGCGLVRKVVNDALILTAVRGASADMKLLPAVFGGEANFGDATELALGTLGAFAAEANILIIAFALPLVVALQRSLRHRQLVSETRLDAKTGLLNAATWKHDAEAELARAARRHTPAAIALIDIDHFKAVNDTWGHLAGDAVLAAVAAGCSAMLREYDIIGRFGGEEFIIMLPDTPSSEALDITERLRVKIPQLVIPDSGGAGPTGVTVSIGVAAAAGRARYDLTSLLAAADRALYKAKDAGRDQVWLESDEPGPAPGAAGSGPPPGASAVNVRVRGARTGIAHAQPRTGGRRTADQGHTLPQISTMIPHPARMYDAFLGGKAHYPADRETAGNVLRQFPEVRDIARANRAFLLRAVRFLVGQGIRQFIDIGCGIPGPGSLHELIAQIAPGAHVVYVDNDPLVYLHAGAQVTGSDHAGAILADAREPGTITGHPDVVSLIDFARPVAVLLVAVVHFLSEDDHPARIVAALRDSAAPGSYIALSHGTADFHPPGTAGRASALYRNASAPLVLRTHSQVSAFFAGLQLVEPGLVQAPLWRPSGLPAADADRAKIGIYAGVGLKQLPGSAGQSHCIREMSL